MSDYEGPGPAIVVLERKLDTARDTVPLPAYSAIEIQVAEANPQANPKIQLNGPDSYEHNALEGFQHRDPSDPLERIHLTNDADTGTIAIALVRDPDAELKLAGSGGAVTQGTIPWAGEEQGYHSRTTFTKDVNSETQLDDVAANYVKVKVPSGAAASVELTDGNGTPGDTIQPGGWRAEQVNNANMIHARSADGSPGSTVTLQVTVLE